MSRLAVLLLAVAAMRGCVAYEYEHEFWVRVDGSGSVNVTGRPELWTAFKGLPLPADEDGHHEAVVKRFRELGYLYVTLDLQGFRSGSANEALKWIAKK